MAGLLTPSASRVLIGALREEFPAVPIHVHTHDSSNSGVAAMIACIESGADAVDAANDAMSGLTSQPAMGAIVYNFAGTKQDTGIDINEMQYLTDYWELVRPQYEPFDSGQKSAGSDVWQNEIPGGQYTNMFFQAKMLGLESEWSNIKRAYAQANILLGDIIKVPCFVCVCLQRS
jgi:pyruvate carboxylase